MDDILNNLKDQLMELLAFAPSLIKALAIFIVGWLLAKVIARVVRKIIAAAGIDKLAERLNQIDLFAGSNFQIVPSMLLAKVLYYIILFVFVMAAVDALGMQAISDLMTNVINYLPKLLSAFLVLLFGIFVADLLKKAVLTTCESLGIASGKLIANAVFYFLFLNVVLITLKQAELQTSFMETNISIILAGVVVAFAVGYGLASRDLMSNLLSAFYNRDRIHIGDILVIEGVKGEVVEMDNMVLTLWTGDSRVIIPLGRLATEKYELRHRSADPEVRSLPQDTD